MQTPPIPDSPDSFPSTLGETITETLKEILTQIARTTPGKNDPEELLDAEAVAEFRKRLPQFMKTLLIVCYLARIQRSAARSYIRKGVDTNDADELASKLVEKVIDELNGGFARWPHGNPGAWIAGIQRHVLVDYWRAKKKQKAEKPDESIAVEDEAIAKDNWIDFWASLPSKQRTVLRLFLIRTPQKAIAEKVGISVAEVRNILQRLNPSD